MQNLKFQKSTPKSEIETEDVEEDGYDGDVESDGEESEVEHPDDDEDHVDPEEDTEDADDEENDVEETKSSHVGVIVVVVILLIVIFTFLCYCCYKRCGLPRDETADSSKVFGFVNPLYTGQ